MAAVTKVTGPAPVTPIAPVAFITDFSLTVDLQRGTYLLVYAGGNKSDAGNIPAATLTTLRNLVLARIEALEGWAPGSSAMT
jgi:hypothetical protein